MSDRERETAFLRRCIGYEDSEECHDLEARVTQAQQNERSVRRAVWLVIALTAVAVAGLCYAAIFLPDFPRSNSQVAVKVFGALGLASLICLPGFLGYWGIYRKELDVRREECRRLAAQLMESRLGKPRVLPVPVAANDRQNGDG